VKRGKYKLKRRAERQEETRLRIARAAVELHGTVGPSKTTISSLAEEAGVSRPTLYSHFPDELSLFKACSSLDLSENPPPDPDPWAKIVDPEERLRSALTEVYAYYLRREQIMYNVLRDAQGDAEVNANLREVLKPLIAHWERMKEILATAWEVNEERPQQQQQQLLLLLLLLRGAIGVALDFQTWRTMVREQDLTDEQAIELMVRMVRCVMRK
jgi:AcrR family transcriptional regulator